MDTSVHDNVSGSNRDSSLAHSPSVFHYDALELLCYEYTMTGPNEYTTPRERDLVLESIRLLREAFDLKTTCNDRLVCRLQLFDLINKIQLENLQEFKENEWNNLIKQLEKTRNMFLSKSVKEIHIPQWNSPFKDQGEQKSSEVAVHSDEEEQAAKSQAELPFAEPYVKIMMECKIQMVLSILHSKLKLIEGLEDIEGEGKLNVTLAPRRMRLFLDQVEKNFAKEDETYEYFMSMVAFHGDTVIGLLPAADLKQIVDKHHLKKFQPRLESLLQNWSLTLPIPTLSLIQLTSNVTSECKHVDKKRAIDLEDVSQSVHSKTTIDVDEISEPNVDQPRLVTLSSVPVPYTVPTLTTVATPVRNLVVDKETASTPSSTPMSDQKKKHIRRRFTDVEIAAIKLGVEKYGVGNWADIKNGFREELSTRTSVQIKDCYRTLKTKGEVE